MFFLLISFLNLTSMGQAPATAPEVNAVVEVYGPAIMIGWNNYAATKVPGITLKDFAPDRDFFSPEPSAPATILAVDGDGLEVKINAGAWKGRSGWISGDGVRYPPGKEESDRDVRFGLTLLERRVLYKQIDFAIRIARFEMQRRRPGVDFGEIGMYVARYRAKTDPMSDLMYRAVEDAMLDSPKKSLSAKNATIKDVVEEGNDRRWPLSGTIRSDLTQQLRDALKQVVPFEDPEILLVKPSKDWVPQADDLCVTHYEEKPNIPAAVDAKAHIEFIKAFKNADVEAIEALSKEKRFVKVRAGTPCVVVDLCKFDGIESICVRLRVQEGPFKDQVFFVSILYIAKQVRLPPPPPPDDRPKPTAYLGDYSGPTMYKKASDLYRAARKLESDRKHLDAIKAYQKLASDFAYFPEARLAKARLKVLQGK